MSFKTWHNYGYGICTDDIKTHSVDRLEKLLAMAPKFRAQVDEWLRGVDIEGPTWNNYMEYDEDYDLGLAMILKEVIEEVEGIRLNACDDFEGTKYLMYQAKYPWELTDVERSLTKERVTEIFDRYVGILTEEKIPVDFQEAENGG